MQNLSKHAQNAMHEFQLLNGETVERVWQGDGYFIGNNPAAKAIAKLQSSLIKLTGGHMRLFLVMTNMRIVLVESKNVWCGCFKGRSVSTVKKDSISMVSATRDTQFCFSHAREISLLTESGIMYSLIVKKFTDDDLKEFVTHMSHFLY